MSERMGENKQQIGKRRAAGREHDEVQGALIIIIIIIFTMK